MGVAAVRMWSWKAGLVFLGGLTAALAVLLALAGNAATATARWPGPLDALRTNPWPWVIGLGALAVIAAGTAVWMQLRPPAITGDPPPPPRAQVPDWFVGRAQTRAVVKAVCRGRSSVGITTSLWGAGGFGKTTLATAVCDRRAVRSRFKQRIYPVTIGRDVRGRAAIAAKVAEVTRFITGDTTEFDDPRLAGAHLGRLLDARPRTLLVLDDVWEEEQLAPFLIGGGPCVRLVTTRNPHLLPSGTQRIHVDAMSPDQALAVLTHNLPAMPAGLVDSLLRKTGRWALLLRLANRLIAELVHTGVDPQTAGERVLARISATGPAGVDQPGAVWDLDDPAQRSQAVQATVEAATTLLPPGATDRFTELGIFAEDELVPLSAIALLWRATGSLTEDQSRLLCADLERLSLITLAREGGGTVSLHDVIRDYLRGDLGTAGLLRLNGVFVDSVAATLPPAQALTSRTPESAWWQLRDGYLLDHLIDHLMGAGRTALAETAAGDVRWVEARLIQRGPSAATTDLTRVGSAPADALARSLAQIAHLLTPTDPANALTSVLHHLLESHPLWRDQIAARRNDPGLRPCLTHEWPSPDAPHEALQRTLTGHMMDVAAVAISPDGTWLASAGYDNTVRLWDRATGSCLATLGRHRSEATAVAIAPDGTWIASAGADGEARLWERATGTCTTTLKGHSNGITAVAVSPDGSWLATAGLDETVRLWDQAGGTCTATLAGHTDAVRSVAIAPDGSWLASAADDGKVWLWDPATATCTATLTGHQSEVTTVAIAPDGTWLATAGHDNTVRLWDRATATCTATLTDHTDWVHTVAIAPDGSWMATASRDKSVRLWDTATASCNTILTGHRHVRSVAIAPDGTWLATASRDRTLRIWDRTTGSLMSSGSSYAVRAAAISPDGSWLASVGEDFKVRLWDRATATCTATLAESCIGDGTLAIAPDGTWLATADLRNKVHLWDRAGGTRTATLSGHTAEITSVVIAPDGSWLASGGHDDTVRLWDRASGTCTATLRGRTGEIFSLAIAPDGTWLAAGYYDGTIRLWDRATGTCTATLDAHNDAVQSVAIAPDGTWLATAGYLGDVKVWNPATGSCTATLTGHTHAVSVAIAPDGDWLATASRDRTVRIYAAGSHCLVAVARTEEPLHSCAWGPNHELAVAGQGGLYLYALLT
ncbi:NB-ARC domain-containing protein [Streptomyces sp. OZ13]|uniref:WD40 domain-containing protein n=1 Tax=Streptomyces sp. OZ13 TaxID=3452210 RepID=UPI003F8C802A